MPTVMPGENPNWQQLLGEVDDILVTMPPRDRFGSGTDETLAWIGRAATALERWNFTKTPTIGGIAKDAQSLNMSEVARGVTALRTMLFSARSDLRLHLGITAAVIPAGHVLDYFDEVRKVVEMARSEVFFVDPYLNADFVSRYLTYVPAGAAIRLLGSPTTMSKLLPAVDLFNQQNGTFVSVRASATLHDRYLFIDRVSCYVSGASFKDGGKNAPALIAQVTDTFRTTFDAYETAWQGAQVHR